MKFAVGMIVYQEGQWFLRQALESVWGWADQIIVVDGSNVGPSTDDTGAILEEFGTRLDSKTRFQYIRETDPASDYSALAQKWIRRIDPDIDYILRVDGDEIFHRDDLEKLSEMVEASKPDTVLFEYRHYWKTLGQIQTSGCYNQRVNLVLRCFKRQAGLWWFGVGGDEVHDSRGRHLKGHPYYANRALWVPVKCYHVGHAKSAQFEHAKTLRYRLWDGDSRDRAEHIWGISGWVGKDMGGVFPYNQGSFCNGLEENVDLPEQLRPENYKNLSPLARHCALSKCDKTDWKECVPCLERGGLVEEMWKEIQWRKD